MAVVGEFSGLRRAADCITGSLVALYHGRIPGDSNPFEAPAASDDDDDDDDEDTRIDSKREPSLETKVIVQWSLLKLGRIRIAKPC